MKTIKKQRHSTKFANKNSNRSKSEKFIIDTEVHVHEDCRLDMQSRQLALNVTRPRWQRACATATSIVWMTFYFNFEFFFVFLGQVVGFICSMFYHKCCWCRLCGVLRSLPYQPMKGAEVIEDTKSQFFFLASNSKSENKSLTSRC